MINQEIQSFCENWIAKANAYENDNLQHVFDKFFTLFVVYNRLYVEATFRMSNKGEINIRNRNSFPDPQAPATASLQLVAIRASRVLNLY